MAYQQEIEGGPVQRMDERNRRKIEVLVACLQ
jgi:hypothetical protein